MTSYLDTNIISIKETFSESLVKIRHDDVILRHVTSFSYIFPYYDVIDKNVDVSKNFADVRSYWTIFGKRKDVASYVCNI